MVTQTFWQQQNANRRGSILLVAGAIALLAALGFAAGYGLTGVPAAGGLFTAGAAGLASVMSLGSYFAGDRLVLAASRAKPAEEADQTQLLNVVRELSIAADIPMPKVYLIDDSAPNAIATGRDPEHASIAVTTGLLEKLNREELQGVIGHELSHVRNLDIRFALLVGVIVGSIALLADMFLRATFWGAGRRSGRDSRGGGGAQIIIFVVAILLAILAPIAARMVQLAVSRQREYLADASSVELTRNPYGLERALAKIGSDREVLEVANRATQHLYFVNPIKKWEERASGLFSTHPAIIDRINRLRALTGSAPLDAGTMSALTGLD